MKTRMEMPGKVKYIIEQLQQHGFEAYAVGGCVRDALLQKEPADWDITTRALPDQVKRLFPRTIDTGIEHGTVTVMIDKDGFEVTTYRIDGNYSDGRHPDQVTFTPSLEEDLKRRDFTINAMAYNEQQGLVDIFGGIRDLQDRVIRCVGDPRQRFLEDALRILRAVRFSGQLGFEIEENTKRAMQELAGRLKEISAERIQVEMVKLLLSGHPSAWSTADETGIAKIIFPELDYSLLSAGERITPLEQGPKDKALRLALFLRDLDAEIAEGILKRLHFDNDTIRRAGRLIRWKDYTLSADVKQVRLAIHQIGPDLYPLFLKMQACLAEVYGDAARVKLVSDCKTAYQAVSAAKDCVTLKQLAISGRDLIENGFAAGPGLGRLLNELLLAVIDEPEKNDKVQLLKLAAKYK